MQGLADGYFVLPYTIQNYLADQAIWAKVGTDRPEFDEAEKAVEAEIDRLMNIKGKRSVDSIHKELGHIMWEYVGMGRTAEGLKTGLKKMHELEKEFDTNLFVPGNKEGLIMSNMLLPFMHLLDGVHDVVRLRQNHLLQIDRGWNRHIRRADSHDGSFQSIQTMLCNQRRHFAADTARQTCFFHDNHMARLADACEDRLRIQRLK